MRYDNRLMGCIVLFLSFVLATFTVDAHEIHGRIFTNDGKQVKKPLYRVRAFDNVGGGVEQKKQDFDPTDHVLITVDPTKFNKKIVELRFYLLTDDTTAIHSIKGIRASDKSQIIDVLLPP